MYYNIQESILIHKVPKNLIKDDGSILINFDSSDTNTLADYGYYTVRNDNKEPPNANSMELESEQKIILDKPYVDILRKWIDNSPKTDNIPSPPEKHKQEINNNDL